MLITLATWLICIPAAYGLRLVITEEPVAEPRITRSQLFERACERINDLENCFRSLGLSVPPQR